MKYIEKLKYIGNKNQLFTVKNYIMTDGKSHGVRAIDVDNGKGLFLTILLDRCLDIYQLKYKGVNYNYISPTGAVHPGYYDNRGIEFLRNFFAGFLTTCGLATICSPSEDFVGETSMTELLGLHGRISNTPAERVCVNIDENTTDGEPDIVITAVMTEARLFGDKYALEREIKISTGGNRFEIRDKVKNIGFSKSPHMILYHLNYGYPFLSEEIQINLPSLEVVPVDDHAAKDLDKWAVFPAPKHNMQEQCYYHKLKKDANGYSGYSLFNPSIGTGIKVEYDAKPLDYFIQWKMPGESDYVLGLEPGNCHGGGRKKAREDGSLKFLEAQEEVAYHLTFNLY